MDFLREMRSDIVLCDSILLYWMLDLLIHNDSSSVASWAATPRQARDGAQDATLEMLYIYKAT